MVGGRGGEESVTNKPFIVFLLLFIKILAFSFYLYSLILFLFYFLFVYSFLYYFLVLYSFCIIFSPYIKRFFLYFYSFFKL